MSNDKYIVKEAPHDRSISIIAIDIDSNKTVIKMDDHKTTCVSRSLFTGIHKNCSTTNYKGHRNVDAVLSEINAVVVDTKNNIPCLAGL